MDKSLIVHIVDKIIDGRHDWLPEELQFQKNYPEQIEFELRKRQIIPPIRCESNDFLIVPYNWTLDKISKAKTLLQFRRCIHAPESAALALFAGTDITGTICIM